MSKQKLAVVAVGGNALIQSQTRCSIDDQFQAVVQTAVHIVDMIEAGWRIVLSHGNGPQVGFILRRSELAAGEVSEVPFDYAVADTQGSIGYMFQKALGNELARRGIKKPVATIVTQTIVSLDDPAFLTPQKPIGAFLDYKTARQREQELGWTVMEDAGRGWRRTVASPKPVAVQELATIATLLENDNLVIACGGGGIPIAVDAQGQLTGVEAVIDKDFASALLAKELQADLFLIPTAVEQIAIHFGTPRQQWLDAMSVQQARHFSSQGQFGVGSMQPKVDAVLDYLAAVPHGRGLVTCPQTIKQALAGQTGTWISI